MSSAAAADHLVGRDGELDRIAGWINDLSAGRGRAVLIEGEPGIGKTALVRAACALAGRKGCQIFWGGGDELGQALPLSLCSLSTRAAGRPARPA